VKPCPEDWRKCGHCEVGWLGNDEYPSCAKAGFLARVLGGDMCPNAPMPDLIQEKPGKEGQ